MDQSKLLDTDVKSPLRKKNRFCSLNGDSTTASANDDSSINSVPVGMVKIRNLGEAIAVDDDDNDENADEDAENIDRLYH